MSSRSEEAFKTVLQVLAILLLVGLFAMLGHKAFGDIGAIAQAHSGGDFWRELARYLFRNLAGG